MVADSACDCDTFCCRTNASVDDRYLYVYERPSVQCCSATGLSVTKSIHREEEVEDETEDDAVEED